MSKADFYARKVKHLQPAPTVVTELLRSFSDPDRDLDQVVQLIRVEPSLTAEILKRSNSVAFAGAEPATSVFEAVSRIGMYESYCAVASLTGSRVMAMANPAGGVQASQIWRHSVMAAVAAGNLAGRVGELEAAGFTAGLLHDLGKTIFSSLEPERYSRVIAEAGLNGPELAAAEYRAFEANHAQVAGCLLAHWGLPTGVVAAVMSHHQSPGAALRCEHLAASVQVANIIAHAIEDEGLPAEFAPSVEKSLEILRITRMDLPEWIEETEAGLERVGGLLHLSF